MYPKVYTPKKVKKSSTSLVVDCNLIVVIFLLQYSSLLNCHIYLYSDV